MSSTYVADLNGYADDELELRQEIPGKPSVADLCPPGALIETNYGSGPYLVDRVTPHEWRGRRCWSITGFHKNCSGRFERRESNRIWINDLVAIEENGKPAVGKLLACNSDRVRVLDRAAFIENRRGQGELF
jgi:hypothetical protein